MQRNAELFLHWRTITKLLSRPTPVDCTLIRFLKRLWKTDKIKIL